VWLRNVNAKMVMLNVQIEGLRAYGLPRSNAGLGQPFSWQVTATNK
jgi:hypothetical protein